MIELDYIYTSNLPNKNANSVHVMHFSESLAKLFKFRLFADVDQASNLSAHYDIRDQFTINNFSVKSKYLYTIFLLMSLKLSKMVYTRDLFCALLLAFGGKKVIWESHVISENILYRATYRLVSYFNLFYRVIVITDSLREKYLSFFDSKLLNVLPDGCRVNMFCRYHDNLERLTVGYVGSFHKGKGIPTVLELAQRLPNYDFIIVGGSASDIAKVRPQGGPNVSFLGYVDQKKLEKIYLDIDIALLPNNPSVVIGDAGQEIGAFTSPLKLFEYMSYGLPIVASDLPVLREVLTHNESLLVHYGEIDEWVCALEKLTDVRMRRALGSYGHQRFDKDFSWDVRAQTIQSLIAK